jgi:hypothetical protein
LILEWLLIVDWRSLIESGRRLAAATAPINNHGSAINNESRTTNHDSRMA